MILKELLTLFISIKYLDEFGSLSCFFNTALAFKFIDVIKINEAANKSLSKKQASHTTNKVVNMTRYNKSINLSIQNSKQKPVNKFIDCIFTLSYTILERSSCLLFLKSSGL